MREIVHRVIRGTHIGHAELFENPVGSKVGKLLVCFIPNPLCGFTIKQFRDSEISAQFEMRPVIKRSGTPFHRIARHL